MGEPTPRLMVSGLSLSATLQRPCDCSVLGLALACHGVVDKRGTDLHVPFEKRAVKDGSVCQQSLQKGGPQWSRPRIGLSAVRQETQGGKIPTPGTNHLWPSS